MDADNGKSGPAAEQTIDREKVKAEREAKRLAKQAAKQKLQDKNRNLAADASSNATENVKPEQLAKSSSKSSQKSSTSGTGGRREEKKSSESEKAKGKRAPVEPASAVANEVTAKLESLKIEPSKASTAVGADAESKASKQLSKAERRAIQEAQRAAKAAKAQTATSVTAKPKADAKPKASSTPVNEAETKKASSKSPGVRKSPTKSTQVHRVKLFNHLYTDHAASPNDALNSAIMHPAIVRLGTQYSSGIVKGSNARCLAFMNAMKLMVSDYETPSQKDFTRGLDEYIDVCKNYLDKCRPVAVSIANAVKYLKWQINQLPKGEPEADLKDILLEAIDTYIRDQIDKAAEAISIQMQEKISDGDVILTFGCSSVIQNILNEAKKSKRDFRVIVVDARPWHEGQEMLRRLVAKNIKCTCVLINAVGFIMPEVTKVVLGAHALLANGYVMSRAGTAQVALVAKSYNVPVLVCCETHKFSERVLTDAFVYNEIGECGRWHFYGRQFTRIFHIFTGDPYDLVATKDPSPSGLTNWESKSHLTPLNLCYDITPPELVSAVVTEVAILPCTSESLFINCQFGGCKPLTL